MVLKNGGGGEDSESSVAGSEWSSDRAGEAALSRRVRPPERRFRWRPAIGGRLGVSVCSTLLLSLKNTDRYGGMLDALIRINNWVLPAD